MMKGTLQRMILDVLAEQGRMTTKDIADALDVPKAAIAGVIRTLHARGKIRRASERNKWPIVWERTDLFTCKKDGSTDNNVEN